MRMLAAAVGALGLALNGAAADFASAPAGQLFDVGAGARGPAMGGAYAALVHDADSLYYNPAGLGLLDGRQASLMRANLFGGATLDYLSYAQNFSKKAGGWGVQFLRLGINGGDGRDELNTRTGSFGYAETAAGFGMGWRGALVPKLSLGAGANILNRRLGGSSDRQIATSLGAQYGPFFSERVTLGAVVDNALSARQGDTADVLPARLRAGASWRPADGLILSVQGDSDRQIRGGIEGALGSVALRAGMAPEGLSLGGGISLKKMISFDVALTRSAALGLSQRASLTFRFGRRAPGKLNELAQSYLLDGVAELEQRRYVSASRSLDMALGLDSGAGGREWGRKAVLLREMLAGMELSVASPENDELRADSEPALLAQRAIKAYLAGENKAALLLAHVAAGAVGKDSVFMRLLYSLAKATRQSVVGEDIVAPAAFMNARLGRIVDAIRAHQFDAAITAGRDCLVIYPENPLTWTRLGSAYYASGDKVRAREAYLQALRFDPSDEKLRRFVETMKE